MKTIDSSYVNRGIITSEVVNYPDDFIPVTDSVWGLKYIIEFNNMDSLESLNLNYFHLASIYDFNKRKWITSMDSLTNNELNKFKLFFEDSVMAKTIRIFKNNVPDSLLYARTTKIIRLKSLE